MNNLITIVAISVDPKEATLYKADGTVVTIPQGSPLLADIVTTAKKGLPAQVNIYLPHEVRKEFTDVEEGTKGVIKFFKVAKSFIRGLINTDSPEAVSKEAAHITPVMLGVIPKSQADVFDELAPKLSAAVAAEKEITSIDVVNGVVQEVVEKVAVEPEPLTNAQRVMGAKEKLSALMENGKSTSDAEFHRPLDETQDTIVAVNTETGALLPDVQKISHQLKSSSKLQDFAGFTKFMERLSGIINDRGHSIEDLMKFMEKGDLPIADDGCIVIYKRLNQSGTDENAFKDCHSGNVPQKVGSFVFMRHGLVDPNRRKDCSNGLHVASLSYLRSFHGGITVIAKVRPEDVFAVPEYSVNKMRVAGYHILAKLPPVLRDLVNSGKSISSDPEGAKLLNEVLRGQHVAVLEHVEIGASYGGKVTVTPIAADDREVVEDAPEVELKNTTLDTETPVNIEPEKAEPVLATELKPVQPEKEEVKMSTKDLAKSLLKQIKAAPEGDDRKKIAVELVALKGRTKKSWVALGIDSKDVTLVLGSIETGNNNVKAEAIQEKAKKIEKKRESGKPVKESPRTLIRDILSKASITKEEYQVVILLKRKAKKSWLELGVNEVEVATILQYSK